MKEKFKDKNKQDQVCDLANWLWLLFIISVGVKLLNEKQVLLALWFPKPQIRIG